MNQVRGVGEAPSCICVLDYIVQPGAEAFFLVATIVGRQSGDGACV